MAPPKAPAKPKTVAEYIAAAPKEARPLLRQMRKTIRAAAPGATESLKWGMPAHSYKRILVMYGAFTHHLSLYPGTHTLRALKGNKDVARFQTSTSTVQFPFDRPLPTALIRRITTHRVKESLAKDGKWRTNP